MPHAQGGDRALEYPVTLPTGTAGYHVQLSTEVAGYEPTPGIGCSTLVDQNFPYPAAEVVTEGSELKLVVALFDQAAATGTPDAVAGALTRENGNSGVGSLDAHINAGGVYVYTAWPAEPCAACVGYCSAGVSQLGCSVPLSAVGTPSASAPSASACPPPTCPARPRDSST